MKKLVSLMLVGIMLFSINTILVAQEWDNTQKEVWQSVEASYELWAKRDIQGFLNYIHEDYCGWHTNSAVPQTKSSFVNMVNHYFPKYETIFYEIKPLDIKIHGNIAIIHYYFFDLSKDEEGKEEANQSRWTDILLKDKGIWVLISDHGGDVEIK